MLTPRGWCHTADRSFDHLVGAGEQRGRRGLFLTLGLIGTIVRPTSIRSSRNSSQFLYFSPDRTEWAEPMLLFGKSVRIGAVWSIDRFSGAEWENPCRGSPSPADSGSRCSLRRHRLARPSAEGSRNWCQVACCVGRRLPRSEADSFRRRCCSCLDPRAAETDSRAHFARAVPSRLYRDMPRKLARRLPRRGWD